MRNHLTKTLLGFMLVSQAWGQQAQKKAPGSKLLGELVGSYSYMRVITAPLIQIRKDYPELSDEAGKVLGGFVQSGLAQSLTDLEKQLKGRMGDKWPGFRKNLQEKVDASLRKQKFDTKKASVFLTNFKPKLQDKIPLRTLTPLIASNTKYSADPALEMKAGWKVPFSSKGMERANGVVFNLDLPVSWKAIGPKNGRMLESFTNKAGYGNVSLDIGMGKLPDQVTDAAMMESIQLPKLKKMAPKNAKLLSARNATLGGQPAGMMIVEAINPEYPGKNVPIRIIQIQTVHQRHLVMLQFGIILPPEKIGELDAIYKSHMPLFQMIAGSLKLVK